MERTVAEHGESSTLITEQSEERVQAKTQVVRETRIPPGLVGEPCEATAWLDDVQCQCLLDTGSQVTCISQSFYQQRLSHRKLHLISDILEVEGAAGQLVPYLGYIKVDVKFRKEECGTNATITTLALVCPDQTYSTKTPLLVGTNVLRQLMGDCKRVGGYKYVEKLQIHANFISAYVVCEEKTKTDIRDAKPMSVRLIVRKPVTISKGDMCEVTGRFHAKTSGNEVTGLIEEPQIQSLPGGLLVRSHLIQVRPRSCAKVKILIHNMAEHAITLQPQRVIAECSLVDWVKPVKVNENYAPDKAKMFTTSQNGRHDEKPVDLNFEDSPVSEQFREHITKRINRETANAFAKNDLDIGHMTGVDHAIELMDHIPFKERTRRVSPADFENLKQHLQDLLAAGIIEESNSPYASPVVLVRKRNGELRMVVDYRKLNNLTKKDAYPLPRIEETFTLLSGSKWFTVLDLKSGYYQLDVREEDCPKTVFTTPFGTWQFKRLPQGLTNSPATFQRTMEKVMAGINLEEVIAFLDDLIIFSDTLEQHEERLMKPNLRVWVEIVTVQMQVLPNVCKISWPCDLCRWYTARSRQDSRSLRLASPNDSERA